MRIQQCYVRMRSMVTKQDSYPFSFYNESHHDFSCRAPTNIIYHYYNYYKPSTKPIVLYPVYRNIKQRKSANPHKREAGSGFIQRLFAWELTKGFIDHQSSCWYIFLVEPFNVSSTDHFNSNVIWKVSLTGTRIISVALRSFSVLFWFQQPGVQSKAR